MNKRIKIQKGKETMENSDFISELFSDFDSEEDQSTLCKIEGTIIHYP